jgi:Mn-containing catalase
MSEGEDSSEGLWSSGNTPDGKGQFEYLANPQPLGPSPEPPPMPHPLLYGSSGSEALVNGGDGKNRSWRGQSS